MWVNAKVTALVVVLATLCQGREALRSSGGGDERRLGSVPTSSSSSSSFSSSSSESTAPEITLDAASKLGVSNLARLISSALKVKEGAKDDDTAATGVVLEKTSSSSSTSPSTSPSSSSSTSPSSSTPTSPSSSTSTSTTEKDSTLVEEDQGVTEKGEQTQGPTKSLEDLLLALTSNHHKKGEEEKKGEDEEKEEGEKNETTDVKFVPATAGQFGELGTGSKLMEYLPDLSQYSVETSNYGAIAGAGAVALMALGAVFAVPAAPIILRRAGMNSWSGLPSISDLFTWWSSPDPSALTWADKNDGGMAYYEDDEGGYYYNGGGEGVYYDAEGYTAPAAGASGYYTDDQQYQYYSYDSSSSGSEDTHRYTDSQGNTIVSAPAPAPAHGGYLVHAPRADQASTTRAPARGPPHGMKRPLWKRNKNRRKDTVDGHEYVTLEEINRIGDESMRILSDLAQGHVSRRRGSAQLSPQRTFRRRQQQQTYEVDQQGHHEQQEHHQQGQQQQHQYAPSPSYEYGQELFTQSYQTAEGEGEQYSEYDPSTAAEGHPYRFSLTDERQQTGQSESESHQQKQERPNGYSRHNLGYLYPGAEEEVDVGSPRTSQNAPLKVAESEFPYKFHKED
ncbi:uncharacterized protein DDB_G0271670-like isoform X3 [Penaeus japonicus]|uniref:uncharacterized protein DDB_G0271670-like isoform X3 n=1 Tax=Penaeus japonicus TaxID=27405 RepID=UPI001C71597E|nr:uncharacterized protein DDB_G0271670-like isoform X3 [Penaeus japonicus]